jgi:putative transcriptional regulator
MSELHAGLLLVATPALTDPNFFRTVVLLMDTDGDGAAGVILNRALDVDAGEHLPDWHDRLAPPRRIFEGGPVQPETGIGVALRPGIPADGTWTPIPGGVGFVDVSSSPDEIGDIAEARIFSGYSGWGAGQLEMEISVGSWFVVTGTVDDVFDPVPSTLWRRVLLRQERHIARYADYPIDPSVN